MKKKDLQPIGTTVIVLNKQNQILMGKRKNGYKEGQYGLPGGRLDRGERVEEGAKRELEEETGLDANKLEYLAVVKEWQEDNGYDFVHFVFICKDWKGDLQLLEPEKCEKWKWFDLDKLPDNILPGHLAGIETLKSEDKIFFSDI
ncbi:MAG: NUDIX domain-containing protein [Candidatus Pacebacteria bacterium]|nr:NUDIX domain-containing protein [Candidatus Paceibacterota bacterium]